jgi:FlgD Ig-like domain
MKRLLTLSFLFLVTASFAQPPQIEWTRSWDFGDDYQKIECVRALPDGGFILAGTERFEDETGIAIRLDSEGNTLWLQEIDFGPALWQQVTHIEQVSDGGFVCCGISHANQEEPAIVVKLTAGGVISWVTRIPDESLLTWIREDDDGNFLTMSRGSPGSDFQFHRLDQNGQLYWSSDPDELSGPANTFDFTADGGMIVAAGNSSLRVIKCSFAGNQQWGIIPFSFGYGDYGEANDVKVLSTGHYLACGYDELNGGVTSPALVKMIEDQVLWRRLRPVFEVGKYVSLCETGDQGIVVGGYRAGGPRVSYLNRTDGNGNSLWISVIDSMWDIESLDIARDGGVVVAGNTRDDNDNEDFYVVKYFPEVELSLQPDIQTLPPEGGTILLDAGLTHLLVEETGVHAIQTVVMPDGTRRVVQSDQLRLIPGEPITLTDLPLDIPANAPAGEYTFEIRIGRPSVENVLGYASFTFEKQAAVVRESEVDLASENRLSLSATPNPFNPATTISLTLPDAGEVMIRVLNVLGREVATLHAGHLSRGSHSFVWDGSNHASGVYLLSVQHNGVSEIQKVVLMK